MDRNSNEWKILGVLGKLYLEYAREQRGFTGLRSIQSTLEIKGVSIKLGHIQLAIDKLASYDFIVFKDFRGIAISDDGLAFWEKNKNSNKTTFNLKPKTEKTHIIKKICSLAISPIKWLFNNPWQKIGRSFNGLTEFSKKIIINGKAVLIIIAILAVFGFSFTYIPFPFPWYQSAF